MSATVDSSPAAADNEVEFRSYGDDAWYGVQLLRGGDGEKLIVKFSNFSDDEAEVFEASKFKSLKKLEELKNRFRPVSVQLQDRECSKVVDGLQVCASHAFTDCDVRFYDAVVEHVLQIKHCFKNGEEQCLCSFLLFWQHGPNAGTLTEKKVENICLIRSNVELHSYVASFLKIARQKIKGAACKPVSASNGDLATCSSSASLKESGSPIVKQKSTFAQRLAQGKCAKRSAVNLWPCEGRMVDLCERNRQDTDVGGVGNHFTILLENLEKELSPSTIIEFIHQQTRIKPQAFVFPSLSSELSTRGVILLDFKKDFESLCDFLNNPNHIIISSKGRPWVVTKNFSRRDTFRGSIQTFMLTSQKKLQNTNTGTSQELKIVYSGNSEYRTAKELRDLFMEFNSHLERLHKRLAFTERKILQPSRAV